MRGSPESPQFHSWSLQVIRVGQLVLSVLMASWCIHGQVKGSLVLALVHGLLHEVPDVVDLLGVDVTYAGDLLQLESIVSVQVGIAGSISVSEGNVLPDLGTSGHEAVEADDGCRLAAAARLVQERSTGLDDHAVDEGQWVNVAGGHLRVAHTEDEHVVSKLK